MSNEYAVCPYCTDEVQLVKRAIYGSNDFIWECPNCKANVTAYSHKPSGYAASPDIRKLRHALYTLKSAYDWFNQYITVVACGKLTKIPEQELQPLYDFFWEVDGEARDKFKDQLVELEAERRRIKEAEDLYLTRLGEVNLQIRADIHEKLPKAVQEKINRKEQKAWEDKLRSITHNESIDKTKVKTPEELLKIAEKVHYDLKLLGAKYEQMPRDVAPDSWFWLPRKREEEWNAEQKL